MKINPLIISVFILASCQPEPIIIDDVPVAESKIVVSSFAGGEMQIGMFLTRSYGALEANLEEDTTNQINKYFVTNAEIRLIHKNDFIYLYPAGDGFYGTNYHELIEGDEYELEIYDWETSQFVSSKTVACGNAQFIKVSIRPEKSSFDTVLVVEYSFRDLLGENFYMINVQRLGGITSADDILLGSRVSTHLLDDTGIPENSVMEGEFDALLNKMTTGDTIMVSLSSITREYHDYLSLVKEGYLGPGLLMEAYNLPTNVNNGYGFFNLYYRDSHIFKLSQ